MGMMRRKTRAKRPVQKRPGRVKEARRKRRLRITRTAVSEMMSVILLKFVLRRVA